MARAGRGRGARGVQGGSAPLSSVLCLCVLTSRRGRRAEGKCFCATGQAGRVAASGVAASAQPQGGCRSGRAGGSSAAKRAPFPPPDTGGGEAASGRDSAHANGGAGGGGVASLRAKGTPPVPLRASEGAASAAMPTGRRASVGGTKGGAGDSRAGGTAAPAVGGQRAPSAGGLPAGPSALARARERRGGGFCFWAAAAAAPPPQGRQSRSPRAELKVRRAAAAPPPQAAPEKKRDRAWSRGLLAGWLRRRDQPLAL